jgi:hypothetical protein
VLAEVVAQAVDQFLDFRRASENPRINKEMERRKSASA